MARGRGIMGAIRRRRIQVCVRRHGRPGQLLHAQAGRTLAELDAARQDAPHRPVTLVVAHLLEERQHAAALSPDGAVSLDMRAQRLGQTAAGRELLGMQFRIAPGQPDGIAVRQRIVSQRREEGQRGPQGLQNLEVGRVDESEGRIASDGNGATRQRLQGGCSVSRAFGRQKARVPALQGLAVQTAQHGAFQRIGCSIQLLSCIGQLVGGNQAQMARGHGKGRVAEHAAQVIGTGALPGAAGPLPRGRSGRLRVRQSMCDARRLRIVP